MQGGRLDGSRRALMQYPPWVSINATGGGAIAHLALVRTSARSVRMAASLRRTLRSPISRSSTDLVQHARLQQRACRGRAVAVLPLFLGRHLAEGFARAGHQKDRVVAE